MDHFPNTGNDLLSFVLCTVKTSFVVVIFSTVYRAYALQPEAIFVQSDNKSIIVLFALLMLESTDE